MAQHDYVIANQSGSSFRSDLNNALSAIVSQNSGSSEPSTTYAYQTWADTTNGVMKMRNGANSAWITLYQLDGEWSTIAFENGTAAAPSIYFKDSGTDTGIYSPGTDQVAISTGGTGRLFIDSSGRVGLGTSSPSVRCQIEDTANSAPVTLLRLNNAGTTSGGPGIASRLNFTAGATSLGFLQGSNYASGKTGLQLSGDGTNVHVTLDGTSGAVGIGTTSPSDQLHIYTNQADNVIAKFENAQGTNGNLLQFVHGSGGADVAYLGHGGDTTGNLLILNAANTATTFSTNNTERARIDNSGRLLVGTSSARTNIGSTTPQIQLEGTDFNLSTASLTANANSAGNESSLILGKSRGTTIGSNTVVQSGDTVGSVFFAGTDGSKLVSAAQIKAEIDGTPGANDMPGRLVFSTTADGAASPTERLRVTQSGFVNIGSQGTDIIWNQTAVNGVTLGTAGVLQVARNSDTPVLINRNGNDGTLIVFAQAGTDEGNISVSGTTVSYNGAHLSRWSQLPGGAPREEILRGTVLSNIDEMCAWGDEDNEQLNRMKVSDVEGDRNVSGVFQAWDDDDDTYTDDFYCAMTGDFIIRIAHGVPVHKGQLLMSAGDGTAKPQDDDIVRSKTIAKVTSNHVTCTYDDGSYCVPCVLMAC